MILAHAVRPLSYISTLSLSLGAWTLSDRPQPNLVVSRPRTCWKLASAGMVAPFLHTCNNGRLEGIGGVAFLTGARSAVWTQRTAALDVGGEHVSVTLQQGWHAALRLAWHQADPGSASVDPQHAQRFADPFTVVTVAQKTDSHRLSSVPHCAVNKRAACCRTST